MAKAKILNRIATNKGEWLDGVLEVNKKTYVGKSNPDAWSLGSVTDSDAMNTARAFFGISNNAKVKGQTSAEIAQRRAAQRDAYRKGYTGLGDEQAKLRSELDSTMHKGKDNPTRTAIEDRLSNIKSEQAKMVRGQVMSYAAEGLDYGKRFLNHTFREGTVGDRFKKVGVYGGAYMGANMAMRGMTGGGVTYNNDGRRDIAGVPFL